MRVELRDFRAKAGRAVSVEKPFFCSLRPDLSELSRLLPLSRFNNLVVIGNGGAVNSFISFYRALYRGNRKVTVISSMEPDLIARAKKENPRSKTVVVVCSTSGTNVGALEIMSQFFSYRMAVVTANNMAALHQIALRKRLPLFFVPHKTDRFMTKSLLTYVPLWLLGINVRAIDRALARCYRNYMYRDDSAFRLADVLHRLEKKGYCDVFVPLYSSRLEGFSVYITQLMHESVSKEGKGQNFTVAGAPESQHHTNQRFFGGQRNVCGLFIFAEQNDRKSRADFSGLADIALRKGSLADIDKTRLAKSFEYEMLGTYRDAVRSKIPVGLLRVAGTDEAGVCEFAAFWHFVAVHSCLLRKVNPYDQPQVEASKEISFRMRTKKG